jgi:hypothetical protein
MIGNDWAAMTDRSEIPVPRAGVRFEEIEGEAVVYDRSGKRASYLKGRGRFTRRGSARQRGCAGSNDLGNCDAAPRVASVIAIAVSD